MATSAYDAIASVYQQYLGRTPSLQEVQGWLSNPNTGGDLSAITAAIQGSPEAKTYAVQGMYQSLLGRQGSPDEINGWIQGTGGNLDAIKYGIKNSDEGKNYHPATAAPAGGTTTTGDGASTGGSSDPVRAAVLSAFQSKGITPRDDSDVQYWVDKINSTNGGWSNPDNKNYWLTRMAQGQGGVGDYQERPESGGGGDQTTQMSTPPVDNAPANTPQNYGPSSNSPSFDLSSYLNNSPLLQPWTQQFSFSDWTPPDKFKAPTALDEQNDPGFQARMDLGQQAIERAAAAKGTLLTGGTLKDLTQFGQDYGSNEYNNVYNRALGQWQNNYNSSLNDWTTNYNKALQGYQTAYNIFENNQAKQYNRISNLAGLGQTAAGQLGSSGLGYSQLNSNILGNNSSTLGALYTGAGNATAAGQVGSANAWSSALNNIGNNLGSLYVANKIFGQQ